ncbi:MAG: hypothetical protein JJLCMIEE_03422 [Acidimicrobiales bacterium]|nr:hypothetical protein [Acidimicrobiales bacterium]
MHTQSQTFPTSAVKLVAASLAVLILGGCGASSSSTAAEPPSTAPGQALEAVEVEVEYAPDDLCRDRGAESATHLVDREAQLVAVLLPGESVPALIKTTESLFFASSLVPGLESQSDWISVPTDQTSDELAFAYGTRLGGIAPGLLVGELEGPLDDVQQLEDDGEVPPWSGDATAEGFRIDWTSEDGRVVAASITGSTAGAGRPYSANLTATTSPLSAAPAPPEDVVPLSDLPAGPLIATSLKLDDACVDYGEGVPDRRDCLAQITTPVGEWLAENSRDMWFNSVEC